MGRIIVLFITIVFVFVQRAYPQQKIVISGYVYDELTREPLIGANVYVKENKIAAQTNGFGFYSLTFPAEKSVELSISFVGYQTFSTKMILSLSESRHFYLKPGMELAEVAVTGKREAEFVREAAVGNVKLSPKYIRNMPNLFGEVDLIKALQLTPGIQSGGEAKSNLYVRGGSPDQNLMLLDDVPLYYVAHFGGFFSVFNTDAISDIEMIKGGFPARYGTRLSSVLDIRMKNGNRQKFGGQGTIGLLSSKISLEGPVIKNKSSFIVSARKNIIPILKLMDTGISYHFYDLNAKLDYTFSDADRIYLSFYRGDDMVGARDTKKDNTIKLINDKSTRWGNTLGALRWNHVFNGKLFSNSTLSVTDYKYRTLYKYEYDTDSLDKGFNSKLTSGILDYGLKTDFSYYPSAKYEVRFGVNGVFHSFIPNNEHLERNQTGLRSIDSTYTSTIKALETGLYLENDFKLKWLTANIGVRLSGFHLEEKSYYSTEPRLLISVPILKEFSAKYSYSKMSQYVHLLSYSGIGMPSDYWMPTTKTVLPENSAQHSLGFYYSFLDGMYQASIETYHKQMNNLIAFRPRESLTGAMADWESIIESKGTGTAKGIELFVQKLAGITTGWIGATISNSKRKFSGINRGNSFPFSYDRLFDASIVVNHELKKNITISGTWNYGTGYPFTLASERYRYEKQDVFVYDKVNGYRMPDFHRLDIALNYTRKKSWGEQTWTISIFNVYNRKNPYFLYLDREDVIQKSKSPGITLTEGDLHLYQKSLFPFFPSFAYSFKF